MTLTVQDALSHVEHTLGALPNPEVQGIDLVNWAGEYLCSATPWKWLIQRSKLLDLRGKIEIDASDDFTWTAATKTLTGTGTGAGKFANYTFVARDKIEISGGTGATTGFYEVASRVDDDSITLTSSIASGDLAAGADITAVMRLDTVALPSDFRDPIDISATDSFLYGVRLTTLQVILHNRTSQVDVTADWNYLASPVFSGTPPVPILEIWPTPASNATGIWTIFYRGKWVRQTNDQGTFDTLPEWMEDLYIQVLRAYARGYEEEDEASLSARLAEIKAGPLWASKQAQDGMVQSYLGRIRGGGAQPRMRSSRYGNYWLPNTVAGPS